MCRRTPLAAPTTSTPPPDQRNGHTSVCCHPACPTNQAQQADATIRDEEFRQDIQSLSDSVVQLHFELYGGVDSWRLKEVEQLLLIANDRLHFSSDVGLAGWALKLADSRLRQLADPEIVPVRGMLA